MSDEQLTCGSLFSGVGGMDIGLQWAGFRHLFFAEIDEYCRAVLAARFPGIHIYEDVKDVAGAGKRRSDLNKDLRCTNGSCADSASAEVREPWRDNVTDDLDDVRRVGEPTGRTEVDALFQATDDGRREAGSGGPSRLDLLCGGFPCQDLSVAGKRAGLAGERSGLFFEFMRIVDALRPRAILIENVEGLYSSGSPKGADFGVVLDSLAERGYLASWRTLDAQHFGVPQRRKRVFVCAIADGDPGAERIGEVLAVSEGSDWDSPTSDPAWPEPPSATRGGAQGGGGRVVGSLSAAAYVKYTDQEFVRQGQLVTGHDLPIGVNPSNTDIAGTLPSNAQGGQRTTDIAGAYVYRESRRAQSAEDAETWVDDGLANTLNRFDTGDTRTTHVVTVGGDVAHTLTKEGHDASEDGSGRGTPVIAFSSTGGSWNLNKDADRVAPTLRVGSGVGIPSPPAIQQEATVRRLTPMECERLMGWPDGWTDIPWNKKDHAPDSRRYAACGNGVVAPVSYWIGARLREVLNAA